MVKRLTPKGIERMNVSKRTEISDVVCPGLILRVTPSGRKSFYAMLRTPTGLKRTSLGAWPKMPLGEARNEVRRLRELGAPTEELTFGDIVERFIEFQKERGRKSWKQQKRQLELHVLARFGDRAPHKIRTDDMFALMKELDKKGTTVGENVFSVLRRIFTWAERRGWVQGNPAANVWADVQRSEPRERVLSDSELKDIWWACDGLFPAARDLTRVLILLGQRRTETSLMTRDQISDGIWTIPKENTKNGRSHAIPLSDAALDIIESTGTSPFVFSSTGGDRSVSGYSYAKKKINQAIEFSDWTFHDFRRTMTTRMAELAIPDHIVDRVLNHSVARSTRAKHYDRYSYMREKAESLETWAEEVAQIVEGGDARKLSA